MYEQTIHLRVLKTAAIIFLTHFSVSTASAQVIFAAPANFGGRTGFGLFQEQNGQVTQLNTGFVEHNFPAISRDSRFVVFSSPDGVTAPLQVPPSSDIYSFDRVRGQTRRIVDHNTLIPSPSEVQTFRPISASLSPNNQILAYGLELTRRQGTANPHSTRELNLVSSANGVLIANPTFGRGPVSDDLMGEFVGLSWDPGGNSFVTPSYVTIAGDNGTPTQLPAIRRVSRNPANGNWGFSATLSSPRYHNLQFPPAATTQMYPAISPSGIGLAYFQVFFPDVLGGSQGVIASLVRANADGSGARVLTQFDQGFYPLGVHWSRDGTQLVFSIARQLQGSSGFLPAATANGAIIRRIPSSGGAIGRVPGIDSGFFPSAPTVPLLPPATVEEPSDTTAPIVRVSGKKRIVTLRNRVVLRGTATDASGIRRLAVNARGAKVRQSKLLSGNRFRIVLAITKKTGRVVTNIRAIDKAGNTSRPNTVRIIRR